MSVPRSRLLADRTRRGGRVIAAALLCALVGFFVMQGLKVASVPAAKIAAWNVVIDDGFYYLQVSRNIARGHGSTFDRVNPTNGYQPLWAAMLVPIFWVTDDPAAGLAATLVLATVLGAIAIILFYLSLLRRAGLVPALLTAALFCLNPYFLELLQGGLETPALFVCLGLLLYAWTHRSHALLAGQRRTCLLFGALLGLTVLSRVDVAIALAPLALLIPLSSGSLRLRLRRTLWVGLAGAALTLPYAAWNLIAHGSPVPVSGLVKRWVVATYQPTKQLFMQTEQWRGLARTMDLLSFPHELHNGQAHAAIVPALTFPAALLALLALRLLWRPRHSQPTPGPGLFVAVTLGVSAHAAYMYFGYRSCSHWNYHYFFPLALLYTVLLALVIPALCADLGRLLDARLGRFAFLQRGWSALALVMVLPPIAYTAKKGYEAAERHQREIRRPAAASFRKSRYDAARYIRRVFPKGTVFGAWWAGNLGYFSNRKVVNLDGVINSREYLERYLKTDTVERYILYGPIEYLVDFFWRSPLHKRFRPAYRAFWWEHDKEHIVKRLNGELKLVHIIRFRGGSGMYVMKVLKPKGR
ncbi:MAG: hypothetical protein CSA65_01455 [Proteobacteria bacterium]|nr:MAG: hypothetical protein CSB49_03125 [Pseudomonadota bacterium]PIE19678.1 MAG: hypothetical protein CSA65_01455 [Pseudomonadota bacterium]